MASLTPTPKMQFLSANGDPLVGGKLYTYAAGTTTPQATYTDYAGGTPNANPVILDSRGEASVWLDTPLYKFKLTDANDVEIWTVDNVGGVVTLAMLAASGGSNLVGFIQAGTGAVARTAQAKMREEISFSDFLPANVVDPTAVDCSTYMQNALNACSGGKVLYLDKSILLSARVVPPAGFGGIRGDGMRKTTITFDREQTPSSGAVDSCIVGTGVHGAMFLDFTIVYTGTYYVPGQSYFGYVSGLYIVDSDDVIVDRVEATGFNVAGVTFTAATRGATDLCKRNKVTNCWLHHNRVAGCLFQWQEFFTAEFNLLQRNGDSRDGGTGYGVAAGSGTQNKQVLYAFNMTDHNYRKGLDVHDGNGYTIVGNRLIGDRIYGMSIENDSYTLDSLTVTDNVIQCDPSFYVSNDDDQPPSVYAFYVGIAIYINPYDSATPGGSIPNILVANNQIKDIGCDDSTHDLQAIYINSKATSATVITVADNHIRGTLLDTGIMVYNSGGTYGTGPFIANVHDNMIRMGPIREHGIRVICGTGGESFVNGNYIDAPSCTSHAIYIQSGFLNARACNNTVSITTMASTPLSVEYTLNGRVWVENNAFKASTLSASSIMAYGQNIIVGSDGNTYNDQFLVVPKRINYLGGANTKVTSAIKALTATTATPVCKIGREYTIGVYQVKWSAFYNSTGPSSVYSAGGVFTFVAAFSDNGQGAVSSVTVLSAHSAKNGGGADLTVTWSLTSSVALPYIFDLVATASANCSVYFEIEQVSVMERTSSTSNPLL